MTGGDDAHRLNAPDETRDVIAGLVEHYRRNADQYRRASYKETRLRVEFVDPFFEALGWDIANVRGYAEPYKEVVHEDAIKVRGATKAPDYCFRIGGQRKFFLEAKKPSVHIKTDPSPAYQLRRYGWSAKLPLSILTDFEEFAVYDCSKRPQETDGPAVARVDFITYDHYLDRLDDIYSIFAKEAILKGSFDRYAEGTRRKRGTTEVDSEFLKEIEAWRELLAKDIARHNPGLSVHDLNFAVQATIDRILFFRIAEDRGVEPYERLQGHVAGDGLYQRLCELYEQADTKYNAGLFDFSERGDRLTPGLHVSDRAVKSILADLYYPQCPYEFSVIGADILGAVYEQFLGKVIRLTPKRYVKVEDKPEVKKAGGVYYTPTYIVDYIVEHTVGEVLKEAKTPEAAGKLRILDPACGSGSFLLGAYQYLLNWHLDYYTKHSPKKRVRGKQPAIMQVREEEWRLSTFERKRILLNNIYGVDIDPQAVEVTKLNLLLKCLEGATEETLAQQLQIFHEPALPNLADNIKCGNSLIGPDYYEGRQLALIDDEESRRVNAFDWEDEFADIMAAGGFDCVIGNPPYGAFLSDSIKAYLSETYAFVSDFETSQYFIGKAENLAKAGGHVSFIVPNTLFLNIYAEKFRHFLASCFCIEELADLSEIDVFQGATVRTTIPFLIKGERKTSTVEFVAFHSETTTELTSSLDQPKLVADDSAWIEGLRGPTVTSLYDKISAHSVSLGEILVVSQGLIPYDKYRGHDEDTIKNRIWHADTKKDETYKRELRGGDVTRYYVEWNGKQWISYGPWLAAPRKPEFFTEPRLLFREITDPNSGLLHVAYADEEFYNNPGIINCISRGTPYSLLYLLGLSNSRLMAYLHFAFSPKARKGVFPKILVRDVRNLPIRRIMFSDPEDVARHDRMVGLVETMLALHKRLAQVKTPQSRERLQRQLATTDQAIDKLVYELYDLSDEEIRTVEDRV